MPSPSARLVSLPPPVDLEMLCQSLVLQGLEVASEFKSYAESTLQTIQRRYTQSLDDDGVRLDAVLGLWGWVQRKCRPEEPQVAKELLLPLPQPVAFPLTLQRMDFITENFDEMKTQLQLIHEAVDNLQSKGEQTDIKLDGLQEQLRRVPTCRCEPQERRTRVVTSSTKKFSRSTKKFSSSSNTQNVRVPDAPRETTMLQINRLELPMEAVRRPSSLHEHSDAILYWIIQAIDGSHTQSDDERGQRVPLHVAKDTSLTSETPDAMHEILASAQNSAGQDQFEEQDDTNAGQDPAMDIAQIYRVLARDDGL